jgi:hypothetical protein
MIISTRLPAWRPPILHIDIRLTRLVLLTAKRLAKATIANTALIKGHLLASIPAIRLTTFQSHLQTLVHALSFPNPQLRLPPLLLLLKLLFESFPLVGCLNGLLLLAVVKHVFVVLFQANFYHVVKKVVFFSGLGNS